MAIRLVQYAPMDIQQKEAPRLQLEKHFLLREGALQVEAGLDHQWYTQGSPIVVCLRIHNRSSRIVKKIQVTTEDFCFDSYSKEIGRYDLERMLSSKFFFSTSG